MYPATVMPMTALDGTNLAVYDWPCAQTPRAVVLIVHGLGEHAGRYGPLAAKLNDWGFAVRGYDQVGHGESDGVRGALPGPTRLIDDLADVVDDTRLRCRDAHGRPLPLFLLGHSLGGLVATHFVASELRPVEGLVLSSPAFDPGLSGFQRLLLRVVPRVAPNLRLSNGLKPVYLSRDPHVVTAYKNDPLVHDRISARLARYIADTAPLTPLWAPTWTLPTLLMYAGADRLVRPEGSRAFLAGAPRDVVCARCFEHHFHEILNGRDRDPALAELQDWLTARMDMPVRRP